VKPGYKQTKIGVIPEDWSIVELGKLFSFKNGPNKAKQFFGYGTPIINYMDVYTKRSLRKRDIAGSVSLNSQEIDNYRVFKGDVLFTRTSETADEVGISSVVLDELHDTVFSGFVLRARPKSKQMQSQFVQYCFSPSYVRKQIVAKSTYTTRALTNGRSLSSVIVAMPTSDLEQIIIANSLSDTDSLITSLEKLIGKKKLIKQGVMQELLTGKRRLPGFSGEWDTKRLGDVCQILKGSGLSKSSINEDGNRYCILYGELFTKYKELIEKPVSKTESTEGLYSKKGDVLLPGSTTTTGIDLAKASALMVDNVLIGGDIIVLRPSEAIYGPYLAQQINAVLRDKIAEKTKGITIYHLHGKDLTGLEVKTPPIEEQVQISNVIYSIECVVARLETLRKKYTLLKQGMMQELLTGRIRLV